MLLLLLLLLRRQLETFVLETFTSREDRAVIEICVRRGRRGIITDCSA